jgi:carboxypeptidase C (cathepsin A)
MHAQVGFLTNLVKVFPSLATRPLYLTGESFAGTYIVSDFVFRGEKK